MTTSKQPESPRNIVHDENILVVKRTELFRNEPAWTGLKEVDFDNYLEIIQTHQEFLPRSVMETNPAYKQIIPYLVFEHNNHYFLMQRRSNATETRLQNKYSLGIGGHIRQEDMSTNSLFDWARREFHEEVEYTGSFTITPLGILNDDSNEVGKVHIGFVFLVHGDSAEIKVKSELKSGELLSVQALQGFFNTMESWTQHVFALLMKNI
jgi:predicted NUDIX family phosphoesterase